MLALFAQPVLAADDWDCTKNASNGNFGGGDGTSANPYLISKAQDLADLSYLVTVKDYDFTGKYFKMTTDITLNDNIIKEDGTQNQQANPKDWTPIGRPGIFSDYKFSGIFDGDGHAIKGLYCSTDVKDRVRSGLFGCLEDAIVKNLNIEYSFLGGAVTNGGLSGLLVGFAKNTQIRNCNIKKSVIGIAPDCAKNLFVGGFAGRADERTKFVSCTFDGKIQLAAYKSLIAFNRFTTLDGGVKGYVTTSKMYISGFAGYGNASYTYCRFSGEFKVHAKNRRNSGQGSNTNYIYIAGFSNEANVIQGCVNNAAISIDHNYVITEDDKSDGGSKERVMVSAMAYSVKTLDRSAWLGSITFGPNISKIKEDKEDKENPVEANLVHDAASISDCALYGTYKNQDKNLKINYYPLYCEKQDNSKNHCAENVSLVYNYDKVNTQYTIPEGENSRYNGMHLYDMAGSEDISVIKNDAQSVLNEFNSLGYVWGTASDGTYENCPLPIACGGSNVALNGDGTAEKPYLIKTANDLKNIVKNVNDDGGSMGKYYALSNDIDMSGNSIDAIGTNKNPFLGTFDGKGYAIINAKLNGALFGVVGGTVKNLAIIGASISGATDGFSASLVLTLGSGENKGTISNCYVGGDIKTSAHSFAGLCNRVNNGSTIENSYFKGRIQGSEKRIFIGGLCNTLLGTINDSYASFSISSKPSGSKFYGIYISNKETGNDATGSVVNCEYVSADVYPTSKIDGITYRNSDSEIFGGKALNDNWKMGVYRPVLVNAKHYEATKDASSDKAYFDAIQIADSKDNTIYHISAQENTVDQLMWTLPNVAVYNPADKSDYILNCTLNPKANLGYTNVNKAEAVKVNMHYPLALTSGKHYYMLCLPGTVQRNDLPEGCKLLIGGAVKNESDQNYMIAVDADSVTAGFPFIAYIPDDVVENNSELDIVMRSRMAMEPVSEISDDNKSVTFGLVGTFASQNLDNVCTSVSEPEGSDVYFPTMNLAGGSTSVAPFTAYLRDDDEVYLLTYVLFDEMSNETGEIAEEYNGQKVDVKLKRALKANNWNTICLPFAMSAGEIAETFGKDTKVEELDKANMDNDGACSLTFKTVENMEAGHSYMIKPGEAGWLYNINNRIITGEAVATTPESFTDNDGNSITLSYCGTFDRVLLGAGNNNGEAEYFVQGGKIYHVADGQTVTMNGFRCYFTVKSTSSAAAATVFQAARLIHSDGTTTDMKLVEVGSTADGQRIYDLQGVEQTNSNMQRGVYIKNGRKYVK